jgi:methyl-accepting chemotaxis protein
MSLNLKMKPKLIAAFIVIGLLPFAIIGLTALTKSGAEIKSQAFQKLTAVREIKRSGIERYFNTIRDQVLTLSEDTMVVDAMQEFATAIKSFREENALSDEQVASMGAELKTYRDNSPSSISSSICRPTAPRRASLPHLYSHPENWLVF